MNITKDRNNNNKILGDSLCPLSFSLSLSLCIYIIYTNVTKDEGKKKLLDSLLPGQFKPFNNCRAIYIYTLVGSLQT